MSDVARRGGHLPLKSFVLATRILNLQLAGYIRQRRVDVDLAPSARVHDLEAFLIFDIVEWRCVLLPSLCASVLHIGNGILQFCLCDVHVGNHGRFPCVRE